MAAVAAVVALAFALFPVLAQAADSAGAQYQDRLPRATGGNGGGNGDGDGGNGRRLRQLEAPTTAAPRRRAAAVAAEAHRPPVLRARPDRRAGVSSAETNPPNGGQAGPSGGTGTVKLGQNAADVQSSNGDDGGSSPLAGILVGLGLGAIVSVIFVVLRARRQRGQSEPVQSPNAG